MKASLKLLGLNILSAITVNRDVNVNPVCGILSVLKPKKLDNSELSNSKKWLVGALPPCFGVERLILHRLMGLYLIVFYYKGWVYILLS